MSEPRAPRRLDWDEAAASLTSARPWMSPAELHGLLVGSVCADGVGPSDDAWLQRVWQHAGEDIADGADHGELVAFRVRALANLEADGFDFDLLLPDEDAPLSERLQALAAWCGGFLSGYGLGAGRIEGLEEDAVTALHDIAAIATVDTDVDDGEQEETDFMQLVEYVRMGVLVVLTAVRAGAGDGGEA